MAGRDTATQIGTGEAQVFEKTDVSAIGKIAGLKYQKEQEKKKTQSGLTKTLNGLDKIDIFPKHQPLFVEKQKDIYDFTNKNIDSLIKGEPGTTMEFQNKLQTYYNDANLSKTIKDNYKTYGTLVAKEPWKYRGTTQEYLNNFSGYDEKTGQFIDVDPLQFKENVDYTEHVLKDLVPIVKMKGKKGGGEYYNEKAGGWIKYDTDKFSPQESENLVYQDVLKNPVYLDQATYEFNQLSPEEKSQYKDPATYFSKIHSQPLTYDSSSFEVTPESGSDNYDLNKDYLKNVQDVNIESDDEQSQTFSTFGKIQHKSPYTVNASISPNWINKEGNTLEKKGANVNISLGETMIVPVFKKGKVIQGIQKTKTQPKSLIVPKEQIEKETKAGNVEYKVYATGSYKDGTEYTSVLVPVEEVEGPLKKKGVPVDVLKQDAQKMNQKNAPVAVPELPKKGDTKQTKQGIAIFDGTKWILKK